MASRSSWQKEKLPQFASDRARGGKTLSILTKTISRPVSSIFMSTARLGATRWKPQRRHSAPFVIFMPAAARRPFCSPQRQPRWANLLRF